MTYQNTGNTELFIGQRNGWTGNTPAILEVQSRVMGDKQTFNKYSDLSRCWIGRRSVFCWRQLLMVMDGFAEWGKQPSLAEKVWRSKVVVFLFWNKPATLFPYHCNSCKSESTVGTARKAPRWRSSTNPGAMIQRFRILQRKLSEKNSGAFYL